MGERKRVVRIAWHVDAKTLAARMGVPAREVLKALDALRATPANADTTLDVDEAAIVAAAFGWRVEDLAARQRRELAEAVTAPASAAEALVPRPPVVAVMGHVDHGKTTLLDRIRNSNVAAGEAGGITQHIGAYRAKTPHGFITFLDTPGHEAFTRMRARGASVTDIVVLVVAADDGPMPQTLEAIAHARAAEVPIVVAINKADVLGADPQRVRRELANAGLLPEEWGGDVLFCDVCAKTGDGIDALLDAIALQAELLGRKADPSRPASGTVLEAFVDRGKGPVAHVLVRDGTLRIGDTVVVGTVMGRVRAMTDERGKSLREAGPATPVEMLGLDAVVGAGDELCVVSDVQTGKRVVHARRANTAAVSGVSPSRTATSAASSVEDILARLAEPTRPELRVVLKADVQGSQEALAAALANLPSDKARVSLLHTGVGSVTERDIHLAAASGATVFTFQTRTEARAAALAEKMGVRVHQHRIIYELIEDVRLLMQGALEPITVEKSLGKAEVRHVFRGIPKVGAVAGCFVLEGVVRRSAQARLIRRDVTLWTGNVAGLRRFKEDVDAVNRGFECGLTLEGCSDLARGDIVECFTIERLAQTL
jgi:translation initiation factor IF-2